MSVRRILSLLFPILLSITYIALPGYCGDVQSQRKQVLSTAISIAHKIHPPAIGEIVEIGLDLANAKPDQFKAVESLFKKVRKFAAHADSVSQYADASRAANSILTGLDQAAPQLAHRLFESWPARPDLGDGYNKFSREFEFGRQRNRLIGHPMDYLKELIPVDNTNAWMVIVWELQSSRPEDARNAFRHILDEYESQQGASISTAYFLSRFLNPDLWDAHMFGRYVNLLRRDRRTGWNYEISCDGKSASLDYSEGEAFQVIIRAVPNHLKLASELLEAIPSLKKKADQVGVLEAIWERGQLRGKKPYVNSPIFYRGNKDLNSELDTLCSQHMNSPDQFQQRIPGLQYVNNFDFLSRATALTRCPALEDIISSAARQMVLNEPDREIRISMALQLLPYYFDNTRLDQKWIDFGFEILRHAGPRSASSDRSKFEDRLVSQFALVDFSKAMAYINSLKEPLGRLQLLIAVIQALDSNH